MYQIRAISRSKSTLQTLLKKLTDRLTNIRIGDEVAQDEKQLEEYQKKLEEANKKFKIQSDNRSLLYAVNNYIMEGNCQFRTNIHKLKLFDIDN